MLEDNLPLSFICLVELLGNMGHESRWFNILRLPTENNEEPVKISDNELNEINLTVEKFHGEWNYTIKPNEKR